MVIMHNMSAQNAAGKLAVNETKNAKSAERLGSGYRINRSADDAAGMTISEKMRWQIRGLGQASDNSKDGISYIQTAEGALNEMHAMMNRCKELCVQAANDTNTEADRTAIQKELNQLTTEIDRIADNTTYNTMNVFSTAGKDPHVFSAGVSECYSIAVTYDYIDENGNIIDVIGGNENAATNYTGDMQTMAAYISEQASKAAQAILSAYPSLLGGSSADLKIGLNLAPMDGTGGTLASAALSMSWSTDTTKMTYTLNVDTADYNITNYNDGSLAATLAHEMTHLIMEDTLTAGMLGQNSEPYPLWFVEGMAQTASGDNGWMSTLNASSTEDQIKSYLSKVSAMPYGAGYLGTLYIAQMASGVGSVSTSSLQGGVDKILGQLLAGKTLSQVIDEASGGKYTSYTDFVNNVSADPNAVQFTKDFIAARGVDGAGSVIAPGLSTNVENILDGASKYTPSYTVISGTNSYTNIMDGGFTFPDLGADGGTGGGGSGSGGITLGGDGLMLQVGSQSGQSIALTTFNASSDALFQGKTLEVKNHELAGKSIDTVDEAIDAISKIRSYYGAVQNRLEHTIANLDNGQENTQAAESRIRDTDMAEEMVTYSNGNILAQAAQAMLAQANQTSNGVLQLLQA